MSSSAHCRGKQLILSPWVKSPLTSKFGSNTLIACAVGSLGQRVCSDVLFLPVSLGSLVLQLRGCDGLMIGCVEHCFLLQAPELLLVKQDRHWHCHWPRWINLVLNTGLSSFCDVATNGTYVIHVCVLRNVGMSAVMPNTKNIWNHIQLSFITQCSADGCFVRQLTYRLVYTSQVGGWIILQE